NPDGVEMSQEQWDIGYAKSIAVFLNGSKLPSPGPQGQRVSDDSFLLFFNAHYEPLDFILPAEFQEQTWSMEINTQKPRFLTEPQHFTGDKPIPLVGRSIVVLRLLD
ncbi:MAG TPA: glycogen debranching enzyme, partial [Allocoleopsis sp.]